MLSLQDVLRLGQQLVNLVNRVEMALLASIKRFMSSHERTRPRLGIIEPCLLEAFKNEHLLVDLIVVAVVGAAFLIALTRSQKRDEKG